MGEVCVAYAPEDDGRAEAIVAGLEAAGLRVRRLEAEAGAVIAPEAPLLVLWSRHMRATLPRKAQPLLLARLDQRPTPPIRGLAAADLQGWRGRSDHRGWRRMLTRLAAPGAPAATMTAPAAVASPSAAAPPPAPKKTMSASSLGLWALLAALILAGAAVAWLAL